MTAKQKAARLKFKAALAEAKKLRKKNCKLTQAQAVKQAFAIINEKERRNPIKKIKKTVTDSLAKFKKGFEKGYYGEDYGKKRRRRKVGAAPTKVKAKKGKRTSEMHTDTKSHNVNIRVMSGFAGNMYNVRDNIEKDIKSYNDSILRIKNSLPGMTSVEKTRAKIVIKNFKNIITKLKNQLREQNSLIRLNLK